MGSLIAIAVVVLLIIAGVAFDNWNAQKRREAWVAVAAKLGLEFVGDDPELPERYAAFKSFSVGDSRTATNVIRGQASKVQVTLGDYRYVTGSGKSSTSYRQTVCVLEYGQLRLPAFFVRPETFLDPLGQLIGGQDFDFDDDPEFSRGFVLQGKNEARVRELFDRPARAWFVGHRGESLRVEGLDSALVVLCPRSLEPHEASRLLDVALDLTTMWAGRGQARPSV